ncbi:hypothetical protein SMC26_39715 [Actinomadura fulvescens]|uniref:Uncharacterized protein n=1 Tax=Actinomadura fulvescens TaxID=46160 RepID=A0ABP6CXU7_9ACTN
MRKLCQEHQGFRLGRGTLPPKQPRRGEKVVVQAKGGAGPITFDAMVKQIKQAGGLLDRLDSLLLTLALTLLPAL